MPIEDELPPLPEDLRAALDAERPIPSPPVAARAAVWARVAATVGLTPPAGAARAPAPSSLSSLSATTRALAGGAALLAIGAVAYHFSVAGPSTTAASAAAPADPPPAVAADPAATSAAEMARVGTAVGEMAGAPRDIHPRLHPMHRFIPLAPPPSAGDLATERALLEQARSSLAAGDVSAALIAVGKHQVTYPRGQLVEEREAIHVRALVAAGEAGAARRLAQRFTARFPNSIFLPAVESTLRTLPAE